MGVGEGPCVIMGGDNRAKFSSKCDNKKKQTTITKIGTWRNYMNPYEMRIPKGEQP